MVATTATTFSEIPILNATGEAHQKLDTVGSRSVDLHKYESRYARLFLDPYLFIRWLERPCPPSDN